LARTTSKYGNVYFVARRLSSADSSEDNSIRNGLFLGICNSSSKDCITMPYVTKIINILRDRIYENAYLAAVAQTRCDAVDRHMDASSYPFINRFCRIPGTMASQQFDLQVVERVHIREAIADRTT